MSQVQQRSPQEILDDHLRESQDGSIESDLARNYSKGLVGPPDRGGLVGRCGCSLAGIRAPVVNRLSAVAARSDRVPRRTRGGRAA